MARLLSEQMNIRMRAAVRSALSQMGRELVTYTRALVDTPVVYVGGQPIRSEPGEPPYKETKELQKGIKYRVLPKATNAEDMQFYTICRYAKWVNDGHGEVEARPFWPDEDQMVQLRRRFKGLVAQKLREKAADPGSALPSSYQD